MIACDNIPFTRCRRGRKARLEDKGNVKSNKATELFAVVKAVRFFKISSLDENVRLDV